MPYFHGMCPNSAFPDVFSLPFLSAKRGEGTTTKEAFEKWRDVIGNTKKGNSFMSIPMFYSLIFILDSSK